MIADASHTAEILKLAETFQKIVQACPELTLIGQHDALRTRAVEVSLEEGIRVAGFLKKTLQKIRDISGFGRGLAAPQIGSNASVFVTFVDGVFITYINPKVVKNSSGQNLFRESCLSCGIISADVKRSRAITIEYTDEKGKRVIQRADSFMARLLQHEYDHLQGIVNVDVAEKASIELMLADPLKEGLRDC